MFLRNVVTTYKTTRHCSAEDCKFLSLRGTGALVSIDWRRKWNFIRPEHSLNCFGKLKRYPVLPSNQIYVLLQLYNTISVSCKT
jgi:hypothetical protein